MSENMELPSDIVEFSVALLDGELQFVMGSDKPENVVLITATGDEFTIPVNAFKCASESVMAFATNYTW
jgi:hypothetical protein